MDNRLLIGVDIGGTKCAVTLGIPQGDGILIKDKLRFPTTDVYGTIRDIKSGVSEVIGRNGLGVDAIKAIGISCGGPLDSKTGVIMSPPNLPGWDNIPIVDILSEEFGAPAAVHNDANACALAEWRFGAGKGTRNMVFMTFGTGLGAGLIIDGKLYTGSNDNAGELGHIRLEEYGPVGYGKSGSFEGFCSGSGIEQLIWPKRGSRWAGTCPGARTGTLAGLPRKKWLRLSGKAIPWPSVSMRSRPGTSGPDWPS